MGRRVLVTGANGFLANHLVRDLLAEGYTVVATVRDLSDPVRT
ncbi:MAG TPA: NAD-dependent epimerase/dehydratase family protein, partial [Candidatus Poseidoniales archaeon]